MPVNVKYLDSAGRMRVLQYMPELIADDVEPPRTNLQAILTRLAENVSDLQRRES